MLFVTAVVVKEEDKNYILSTLIGGQPLVFLHICEENECDVHEFEVASLESIMRNHNLDGKIVEFEEVS